MSALIRDGFRIGDRVRYHGRGRYPTAPWAGKVGTVTSIDQYEPFLTVRLDQTVYNSMVDDRRTITPYPHNVEIVVEDAFQQSLRTYLDAELGNA